MRDKMSVAGLASFRKTQNLKRLWQILLYNFDKLVFLNSWCITAHKAKPRTFASSDWCCGSGSIRNSVLQFWQVSVSFILRILLNESYFNQRFYLFEHFFVCSNKSAIKFLRKSKIRCIINRKFIGFRNVYRSIEKISIGSDCN